jgi:hypothetical protein
MNYLLMISIDGIPAAEKDVVGAPDIVECGGDGWPRHTPARPRSRSAGERGHRAALASQSSGRERCCGPR